MKKVLALVLALAMVFCFAACGNKEKEIEAKEVRGVEIPKFSIKVNGVKVTNETMKDYPVYEVEATTTNSSGTESTVKYQGFALKDICAAAGLKEEYTYAKVVASDDYEKTFTENVMKNYTLVAITKDGKALSAPQFAPCASKTTGDYVGKLAKILVNTKAEDPDVKDDEKGGEESNLPEIKDVTEKVTYNAFSFKVNGQVIDNAKMEGYHKYKITVTTTNSKGVESTNTYGGYRLSDVLKVAGIENAKSVKTVASDGYESELSSSLINSEYTLLAIEKDKAQSEDGTVWVAPCSSTFGNVYSKLVVELKAE